MAPEDFQGQWRERLASGSKLAARALSQALKEDSTRLALVAPLAKDPLPTVRVATLRAFEEIAQWRPALVAPYASEIVAALGSPEPDAQAAALAALTQIAPQAPAESALALPLIADMLKSKRPALREEAARCLGKLGHGMPERAGDVALRLAAALDKARNPRASMEAREILAALEGMLPHLAANEREAVADAIMPMRGHPNIQVRERAGRLARALA